MQIGTISGFLQVGNSQKGTDLQDPARRLCVPFGNYYRLAGSCKSALLPFWELLPTCRILQVGSASLLGIITDLQDRDSCRIACAASIGLMEQHQQTKEAPGVAGQLLAAGGSTEHFASPFSPILGEGTLEDSFDNDELGKQPGSANAAIITKHSAVITSQLIQSPGAGATTPVHADAGALGGDVLHDAAAVQTVLAEGEVKADNEGDNRHTLQQCSHHR
jgi:hypothetical protein